MVWYKVVKKWNVAEIRILLIVISEKTKKYKIKDWNHLLVVWFGVTSIEEKIS